jgi:5'(3')-deoxyribonucleotidase
MKDKAAVGADLYIEDSPGNVESLRKDGHSVIVFTNSTNRKTSGPRANSWREIERLVLAELKRWRSAGHGKGETSGR